MLKLIIEYLGKISNGRSIIGFFLKKIFKNSKLLKIESLIKLNSTDRPHYTYCVYNAARLAKKLNLNRISIIEFGVAEGNGLASLEKIVSRIEKELEIQIDIFGFDTGSGLVQPKNNFDLPYFFKTGMYKMDIKKLKSKLTKSQLIIGDVKETINNFFKDHEPAPIGAIFNDLDYHSSTIDSFKIFDSDDKYFLPRVFCYFDDVIGSVDEMYGEFSGELLAINDFNKSNKNKKIFLNRNLVAESTQTWRYQIYYFHNFDHPKYNSYIGDDEQTKILKSIKLKN